ncbi:MAG: hypothetical protein KDD36_13915 [Flavobacteriales bacterium]|nr:hypothetical protein [Flavobacteriales bacterium]
MNQYSENEKLNLFKSLFKGREGVFAVRWEKGSKNGYMPAYLERSRSGKGLGNLIALPLHKPTLEEGNSCFVDEQLEPYQNQWKFLSTIQKVSDSSVINIRYCSYTGPLCPIKTRR